MELWWIYDFRPEEEPREVLIGEMGNMASVAEERVMITHDVSKLANYNACDDDTKSEIWVPIF